MTGPAGGGREKIVAGAIPPPFSNPHISGAADFGGAQEDAR